MSSRDRAIGAVSIAPPILERPFYVDRNALCLAEDAAEQIAREPAGLISALVQAAGHELYVGTEAASRICALAGSVGRLPPSMRGEGLVDLLMSQRPADAIDLAVRLGVLRRLLPDIDRLRAMPRRQALYKNVYSHTLKVIAATPPDRITRLAALLHDVAKPDTLVIQGGTAHFPNHDVLGADRAARRLLTLGFDEPTVAAVEILVRLHLRANSYEPNWTDSAVRRLRLEAGGQWKRLLELSFADVTSARTDVVVRAKRRVQALAEHAAMLEKPVEVCPLDGDELMQRLERGPGRWIGELKQFLIEQVREGQLDPDDKDAAWAVVFKYLGDRAENPPP